MQKLTSKNNMLLIYCDTVKDCERMFRNFDCSPKIYIAMDKSLWAQHGENKPYLIRQFFKKQDFEEIGIVRYDRIPEKVKA